MPYIEQGRRRPATRARNMSSAPPCSTATSSRRTGPRAYALMSRAAADGLPPAVQQLQAMEQHLTAEERARGEQLAEEMARDGTDPDRRRRSGRDRRATVARAPASAAHRPGRTPRAHSRSERRRARVRSRSRRASRRHAPLRRRRLPPRRAAAGGSSSAPSPAKRRARSAWAAVSGRLPGLRPTITRAGAMFRLQAGGLASRDAAARACAAARTACFPVAP